MRVYYWKSVAGSSRLLEEHHDLIASILSGDYNHRDLEKLRSISSYPIYSMRLNYQDRLLFTTHKHCLHVLEFVPNHHYQKSRVLRHGVSEHDFTCLSDEEFRPTFEAYDPVIEAIPLEYYNKQFISLNEEQDAATRTPLPAVVLGSAGTGKTLVALSRISHDMQAGQTLLYVSKTSFLVDEIQQQWQDGFVVADDCQVAFKTYNTLFGDLGTIVGEPQFGQWFDSQKEDPLIKLNAVSSYAECFTCSGFSREDYLDLGARQSKIAEREARMAFYDRIFTKYGEFLKQQAMFDPAFSCVPAAEPAYDLMVVDEAQNFSLFQLRQLERMSRAHAIIYCMDAQQNLFTGHSVRDLLAQSFFKQNITLSVALLETTHRYTQNVAQALDNIKCMARTIQGGCLDKRETASMSLSANDIGTFRVMKDSIPLPDFVLERASSTEFAVVTMACFRDEAIKKFNTQLVLTPEESIGQEFHTVVVYKLMSDSESQQIIRQIRRQFAGTESVTVHLPKEKRTALDPSIQTWINRFYVACSRAKDSLIIMQSLGERDRCIFRGFSDKGDIQSVALKTDWSEAEARQRSLGNIEVVELIAQAQRGKSCAIQESKTNTTDICTGLLHQTVTSEIPQALEYPSQNAPLQTAEELTMAMVSNNKKHHKKKRHQSIGETIEVEQKIEFDTRLGKDLMKAVGKNNEKKIQQLLKDKRLNPNLYDQYHCNALLLASIHGYLKIVNLLLNDERVNPNPVNFFGENALILASKNGHLNIVERLLNDERIDPNHGSKVEGRNALMAAFLHGHIDIVKLLLAHDKVDPNQCDESGLTLLIMATKNGHLDITKILLANKNVDPDIATKDGMTPLMMASVLGHLDITKILLADKNVDPNKVEKAGLTPLMLASLRGHLAITTLLLADKNVDPNKKSKLGSTALITASAHGRLDIMKCLLADKNVDPNITNLEGLTALNIAHLADVNRLILSDEAVLTYTLKSFITNPTDWFAFFKKIPLLQMPYIQRAQEIWKHLKSPETMGLTHAQHLAMLQEILNPNAQHVIREILLRKKSDGTFFKSDSDLILNEMQGLIREELQTNGASPH